MPRGSCPSARRSPPWASSAAWCSAEGGRPVAVLVALSFFALAFSRTGFFMDLARVDSLFLFMMLIVTYLMRHGRGIRSAIAAGLLLTLAFFTKQTALLFGGAVLAGSFFGDKKRAVLAGATFAVTSGITFELVNHATDGWYRFYVFTVPGSHAMRWDQWWPLFRSSFWEPLPFALGFALVAATAGAFEDRRTWLYPAFGAGALVSGYMSLMKQDGFVNGLMPWVVSLSLLSGIAVEAIARSAGEQRRWYHLALGFVSLQWLLAIYSPRDQIPARRDRAGGEAMIERLRKQQGPVLAFDSNFYATMAGHPERNLHTMALMDVLHQNDPVRQKKLVGEITAAIASGKYATIVTDDTMRWLPAELMSSIRAHYKEGEPPFDRADVTWTRTGVVTRPTTFWIARQR